MTNLSDRLIAHIRATGPMPLSQYMTTCLLDPKDGYYTTRNPIGATGDFTTAPEISQMFGELIGLCFAQSWLDQGAPDAFNLVELGPGRGTLMADILRAVKRVPGFIAAARITLVEASGTLRAAQKEALHDHPVDWVENLEELPEGPLFLVANEFLDALPIDQYQRRENGWSRCEIGAESDRLIFGLGAEFDFPPLRDRLGDTKEGDIVEHSAAAITLAEKISDRIASAGGIALIFDYGDWRSKGDTFQALSNHKSVDPLADPGRADLTAHVDFEAISMAFSQNNGAKPTRMTPQGVFLERLGITQRAQTLAKGLSGEALETHIAAHRRLTHPEEMGTLFKAMAVVPKAAPTPAGFEL